MGPGLLTKSLAICAFAAGKAEPRAHPLTNLPPAGDITTAHFFPEGSGKVFTAGQPVSRRNWSTCREAWR